MWTIHYIFKNSQEQMAFKVPLDSLNLSNQMHKISPVYFFNQTEAHWQLFCETVWSLYILLNKTLMSLKQTKLQWNLNEIELLKELYPLYCSKKWKKISKEFKKQGFKRSEVEVREKWTNCIDPNISNEDWNQEELQTLYQKFSSFGSKWSIIHKSIPGRTQNKIKNKFYGNLRIFIRFVECFFSGKNSKQNGLINKIPPYILIKIYAGEEEFSFLEDTVVSAIRSMNYSVDKLHLLRVIEQNLETYQTLHKQINGVLSEMRKSYEVKNMLDASESYYSEKEGELEQRQKKRIKLQKEERPRKQAVQSHQFMEVSPKKQKIIQFVETRNYSSSEFTEQKWTTVIEFNIKKKKDTSSRKETSTNSQDHDGKEKSSQNSEVYFVCFPCRKVEEAEHGEYLQQREPQY